MMVTLCSDFAHASGDELRIILGSRDRAQASYAKGSTLATYGEISAVILIERLRLQKSQPANIIDLPFRLSHPKCSICTKPSSF